MLDRYQASELFVNITPTNGATQPFRGLIVSVAGNINVKMNNGSTVVIPVPAGFAPICGLNIESTSTTATGLVALF
jgi:hypothetical protein